MELTDFGFTDPPELNKHPLSTKWRIRLHGRPGERVFILLRSLNWFYVLAPLNLGVDFNNQFSGDTLIYPQRYITFNQNDGSGWRELIVIKARSIPFTPRHPDEGFAVDINELECFAHQLLEENERIEVMRYAFKLIE